MTIHLFPWISLIQLFFAFPAAQAELFTRDLETAVHYKRQVPFYLQHELGDVSIQGWNQDFIQVRLKKSTSADSRDQAESEFRKFELISLETPNAIELRMGTPQGTDLLTKLRNRQKKTVRVDLEIKAPSSLPLTLVLGSARKMKLSQWKGKLSVTGKQNTLELSKLHIDQAVSINCPQCSVEILESEFHGSILGSDQKIALKKVKAISDEILISAEKGNIDLEETEGGLQIRTGSGEVASHKHQGMVQIQTDSGRVRLSDFSGDLDIQTKTGAISAEAKLVKNRMELRNQEGAIDLSLPHSFQGEVNLQSLKGEVSTDFTLLKRAKKTEALYGPELKGKIFGTIGDSSKIQILVSSNTGKIELHQKTVQEASSE